MVTQQARNTFFKIIFKKDVSIPSCKKTFENHIQAIAKPFSKNLLNFYSKNNQFSRF